MFEHSNSKIYSEADYLQKSFKAADPYILLFLSKSFLLHKTLYSTSTTRLFFPSNLKSLARSILVILQCLNCLITCCLKFVLGLWRAVRLTLPYYTQDIL